MVKILNTIGEVYSPEARAILERCGEVTYRTPAQDKLAEEIEKYNAAVIGLGLNFTKDVLKRAGNLKVLATATTGLDHIDTDYAAKKSITVLSLRGEEEFLNTITSTGELAFSLMLDLMRMNPWAFEDVVKHNRWDRERFRGRSLYGKTIGIVGMGRLGRIVAAGAKGFRMNVLFSDPNVEAKKHPEYKKVSFDELLKRSDIVSIHVHLAPDTKKLFDDAALRKMKKGAYLINTSRGEIVDEDAIIEALKDGRLAGYGTDVLSDELTFEAGRSFSPPPLVQYAMNQKKRNVIILPHTGGMTHDSRIATDIFIAEKVLRHIEK